MKETESTCNVCSIRIGIDLEIEATGFGIVITPAGMDGMS